MLKANEAFEQRARAVQAVVPAEGGADVPLWGLDVRKLDGGVCSLKLADVVTNEEPTLARGEDRASSEEPAEGGSDVPLWRACRTTN